MLKSISVVVLGVVALTSVPLEAQIFRRFSPQQRVVRQAYNQPYVQPNSRQDAQYNLNAVQANRSSQTAVGQSAANCTCNQNQQAMVAQRNLQPVASPAGRRSVQDGRVAPAANAAQQQQQQQQQLQRHQQQSQQQRPQQQQQQRYAVFYNPQTNQTFLRPIQAVAKTVQNSNLNPVVRRQVQSPQAPAVARTQQYAPARSSGTNQYDIAQQRVPVSQPNLQLNPPVLNAPLTSSSPAPSVATIEPAISAPVGTLTSQPTVQSENTPIKVEPAQPATQTFSILDAADKPTPTPAKSQTPEPEITEPKTAAEPTDVQPILAEPTEAAPTLAEPSEPGEIPGTGTGGPDK